MNRRDFLARAAAVPVLAAGSLTSPAAAQGPAAVRPASPLGRLSKQAVAVRALLGPGSLEEQCQRAQQIGITGFDLADNPADWPTMKQYGLICTMWRPLDPQAPPGARAGTGRPGWGAIGMKEAQGVYLEAYHACIDQAAASGISNMLLQTGVRGPNQSSEQGMDNTVAFCNAVKAHAEDKNITLCMELVNSKGLQGGVGTLFDHTSWGVEVIKRVNSPRVKILYDVFHAQIMEGFIVQTIRDNIQHFAHIHFGGVPGRHELDETQELNYRFIAQAIADLNFQGYVAHEWQVTPGKDPFEMLKKSMAIINV